MGPFRMKFLQNRTIKVIEEKQVKVFLGLELEMS